MGDPKGFINIGRETTSLRSPLLRIGDFEPHELPFSPEKTRTQASRCMECGIPFCMTGCPLSNMVPDFNDYVFHGNWEEALRTLHATNNFPEFTGKVCPAPCEDSCVLGSINPAVTIKHVESAIIAKAFEMGYIVPIAPRTRSGKTIAIIGAGPAGLACAQQLNRAGHTVTIFDKAQRAGGLLTYGIPAYKLPKALIARRVNQLRHEGIEFKLGCEVGVNISYSELKAGHDAVILAIGCEKPRDLALEGRELGGIHFAMDFLSQQTRTLVAEPLGSTPAISARGRRVIVIGGGDTGADCTGVSLRQGAESVVGLEIMPRPPACRAAVNPWPQYALIERMSTSLEENLAHGGRTEYGVRTKRFIGDQHGRLVGLETERVEWVKDAEGGPPVLRPLSGSEERLPCDLVLLALGYLSPKVDSLVSQLNIEMDERGRIKTNENEKMTNVAGVFATGDCRRGQSLVAWAIAEGRDTAACVDSWLTGKSSWLPRTRSHSYNF